MEKPSGSGREQGVRSSLKVPRMKKQKTAATSRIIDAAATPLNIHKISDQPSSSSLIQSQTHQSLSTPQTQPGLKITSQAIDQLENDDPLASLNNGESNQLSGNMITEMADTDAELAQIYRKIDKMRAKVERVEHSNRALKKSIDGDVKNHNELVEIQNIAENRRVVIRDHTVALQHTLTEFQMSKDKLKEIYGNLILNQAEKIKNLKEKLNEPVSSKETKELEDQLTLKLREILHIEIEHQSLKTQVTQIRQKLHEINGIQEAQEKMINENQQNRDEETKTFLHTVENIEINLDRQREENSKLSARNSEISERYENLVIEFQALQGPYTENENQIKCLKFSVQELNEKQQTLKSKIEDLKNTNLAISSERDLELAASRKELQDLTSKYTETTDILTEITSNNEKLSFTIAESVQRNEELKKASLNKDTEMAKFRDNLNDAMLKKKKLSAELQSLDEKLTAQKKLLLQTKVDLKTSDANEDANSQRETAKLEREIATATQKLKNKIDDKANLHKKMNAQKLRSCEERKKFKQDIVEKDKWINDLRKIRGNHQRDMERIESENNKKLQQIMLQSLQCQRAGHKEQLIKQNVKINLLKQQISTEKMKDKQLENVNKTDNKEKEIRETDLKEMKSGIDAMVKLISEAEEQQIHLRKLLKKAQTDCETERTTVQESLNSSELLGIMNRRSGSIPTSSTPEDSSLPSKKMNFGNESFSDLSSINGSDIFEEAASHYSQHLENNKTDNIKFGEFQLKNKKK